MLCHALPCWSVSLLIYVAIYAKAFACLVCQRNVRQQLAGCPLADHQEALDPVAQDHQQQHQPLQRSEELTLVITTSSTTSATSQGSSRRNRSRLDGFTSWPFPQALGHLPGSVEVKAAITTGDRTQTRQHVGEGRMPLNLGMGAGWSLQTQRSSSVAGSAAGSSADSPIRCRSMPRPRGWRCSSHR